MGDFSNLRFNPSNGYLGSVWTKLSLAVYSMVLFWTLMRSTSGLEGGLQGISWLGILIMGIASLVGLFLFQGIGETDFDGFWGPAVQFVLVAVLAATLYAVLVILVIEYAPSYQLENQTGTLTLALTVTAQAITYGGIVGLFSRSILPHTSFELAGDGSNSGEETLSVKRTNNLSTYLDRRWREFQMILSLGVGLSVGVATPVGLAFVSDAGYAVVPVLLLLLGFVPAALLIAVNYKITEYTAGRIT